MAEEKKKPSGWDLTAFEAGIVLLFLLALSGSIIPAISGYVTSGEISFYGFKLTNVLSFLKSTSWFFKALGITLAGGFLIGTIVLNKMANNIVRISKQKMFPVSENLSPEGFVSVNENQERWKRIISLSESESSSDWRLSIIEADIMLDELLQSLRLPGDTMGDKLKAVEPSDFLTLDNAWEAHKIRNNIAHESGFLINQREVRRVISLYESVFREFEAI